METLRGIVCEGGIYFVYLQRLGFMTECQPVFYYDEKNTEYNSLFSAVVCGGAWAGCGRHDGDRGGGCEGEEIHG